MEQVQVIATPEFRRVQALPRRQVDLENCQALIYHLTNYYRTPNGQMTFRAAQAMALFEAWQNQGFLGSIGVGLGKTLISLMLVQVLASQRPLLVLEAGLIEKTKREWRNLSLHWQTPRFVRMISYEIMGRKQSKNELDQFEPDLIVFDEVHRVKDKKSARTRRFDRYIKARRQDTTKPFLRCAAMSGSLSSHSIKEYAHIAQWCLPHGCPLPWTWSDLEAWAAALDEGPNLFSRVHPGALLELCAPEDVVPGDSRESARRGWRRRLEETPGFLRTTLNGIDQSVRITEWHVSDLGQSVESAFQRLRDTATLPDGWELADGKDVARHAKELALGFYYVWDPRPPIDWLEARMAWHKFVRHAIRYLQPPLDSEQEVAERFPGVAEHVAWKQVKDRYKIGKRPIWLSDVPMRQALAWAKAHPKGIIWVQHIAVGEWLDRHGIPYFRDGGYDKNGRYIEDAIGPVCASAKANTTGRNLQFKWADNLHLECSASGLDLEQRIGRTHRPGQLEDTVTAEVYLGSIEYVAALEQATRRAKYLESTLGPQKLCYGDVILPTVEAYQQGKRPGKGPRWTR